MATTLGTGAERSQSVVVDTASGRVILGSPSLRPRYCVVEGGSSRGLPRALVMGGVVEAVVRAVGPLTAGPSHEGDALGLATARRLLRLGTQLAEAADPGSADLDPVRAEVGSLSSLSQSAALHGTRDSTSFPAWCLVTEHAWVHGVEKAASLALLLPACWEDAEAGHETWATPAGVDRVAAALGAPGSAPSQALTEVFWSWGALTTPVSVVDADDDVARRVVERWGSGADSPVPHVGEDDVRRVLARCPPA